MKLLNIILNELMQYSLVARIGFIILFIFTWSYLLIALIFIRIPILWSIPISYSLTLVIGFCAIIASSRWKLNGT